MIIEKVILKNAVNIDNIVMITIKYLEKNQIKIFVFDRTVCKIKKIMK